MHGPEEVAGIVLPQACSPPAALNGQTVWEETAPSDYWAIKLQMHEDSGWRSKPQRTPRPHHAKLAPPDSP